MSNYKAIICLLFLSLICPVQVSLADTKPVKSNTNEKLLNDIRALYSQMEELSEKSEDLEGEQFLKNDIRMWEINKELRGLIDLAIKDNQISDLVVVDTIAIQREDAEFMIIEIPKVLNEIADEIYDAENKEKLKMIGEYRDFVDKLDLVFEEELQNLIWLKAVGIDISSELNRFKDIIEKRLIQIEETIHYLTKNQTLNRYF